MKPPVRRRVAPKRLEIDPKFIRRPTRCLWKRTDKFRLLRALKVQAQQKEINMELLKKELPKKTEGEIMDFIRSLMGRVARESVRKEYRRYRAEKCWAGEKILSPIEVWTELIEKVSYKLEDAVTAAFSQILTIAATEPTSLLHSIPTKPTKIPGKKLLLDPAIPNRPSPQESPGVLSSEEENIKPSLPELTVDFENIYKYLFALSRGNLVPELTSFESAVLLDLLLCLPKELDQLDCLALRSYMYQSFRSLNITCRQASGSPGSHNNVELDSDNDKSSTEQQSKHSEENKSGCPRDSSRLVTSGDERASSSEDATLHHCSPSMQLPSSSQPSVKPPPHSKMPTPDSKPLWKDLGICPLNVFQVPLKVLCQTEKEQV